MNKRKYYIILLFALLFSNQVYCDVFTISDSIPNFYTKVTNVYQKDPSTIDSVRVSNTGLFSDNDLALLIQMKGAEIDLATQTIMNIHNSGKYEVLKINDVDDINGYITFSSDFMNEYDPQQAVQLIHIPDHYNATIKKDITCKKWDGQTGGVLVLFAQHKLVLEADINVNGKGFRGADPTGDVYNGDCSSVDSAGYSRLYFTSSGIDSAGKKGEGIIYTGFPYTRGMGSAVNGGGGGNGMLAGGYGGGNLNYGGTGGDEYSVCNTIYNKPQSAKIPSGYYTNNAPHNNRIFLGGGGGCGTQIVDGSATKGGDGGGIVIIITDTLETNNHIISSNGQNVTDTANNNGGAGGGGAGGTILLDAQSVIGTLNIEAKGGNGGYTKGSNCTGPGSGGGGGLFWFSDALLPIEALNLELNGGRQGRTSDCGSHGTTAGSKGDTMSGLNTTLNGFLYNYIKEKTKKICQGDIPLSFTATMPKGGDGTYSFIWQHKSACCDWEPAYEGTYMQKDLSFINPLIDTMQYRRIVVSGGVYDTSEIVQVNVIPSIQNNTITDNQTICFGNKSDTLKQGAVPLAGGIGSYQYQWEYSYDAANWDTVNDAGIQEFYFPGTPADTVFYRREVTSGLCSDTSNILSINVLPVIANNIIPEEQYVCGTGQPDTIQGSTPTGGDGVHYSYKWEKREDTSMIWDTLGGQDTNSFYLSGVLSDTTYYRRIVYSGTGQACVDTTNIHAAKVIPPIENNLLSIQADTVCKHSMSDTIKASLPQKGGGMSTYQYEWIKSFNDTDWESTACTTRFYAPDMISEPVSYKRIVHSYTCHDTSNKMHFTLYPSPNAVLASMDTSICSGDNIELSVSISGEYSPWEIKYTGGYGTFDSLTNIHRDTMMIVTPETSDSNKQFRYQIATITNRLGCSTSDTNNIAGTAVINTFGWPTPYAGPDIEFCDTTGVMNATHSYGNIQWQKLTGSNPVTFEHPQNPDTRVNVNITHEETFTFILNETNWQCQSQDTLNVTFYFPPQPDAGEDIVLMFKRDTVLHADSLTHNETAYWEIIQGAGYIENDSSLSTEIHDLSYNEKNYITWNVKKGVCDVVSDTIEITILDMEIPTGFSPNNDGVNDRFFIKGLNESDKNELIVFNKWGNIVYSSKNYQNDWEGYNQNNKQLMEDTYFYVLKVKGEISSEKSGFIVIKR